MSRPTLQQLAYLVALDEHRHFTKAAEACLVSQPGLSTQVRELERRLGAALIERTGKGVILTAAGADAARRARVVLREVDDIVARCDESRNPLEGVCNLGVIPTVAPYFLPRLIPALRAHFPRCQMRLREERTGTLVDLLEAGVLDLLLLALPVEGAHLTEVELATDPFELAVATGHRLARRRSVPVSALADEQVLLLDDGHCLRGQALAVCQLAGARPEEDLRATSLATLVQMVAGGLGVTLLPRSAAAVEAGPASGITTVPLRAPVPYRTLGLAWRSTTPHDGEYRRLASAVAPLCGPPERP